MKAGCGYRRGTRTFLVGESGLGGEKDLFYLFFSQDLIKYTPDEHPDHEMLQTFMKRAQEFLEVNYSLQPDVDVRCFREMDE